MKKLLIMMLVLGLASAANAAYSYNWTDTSGNDITQGVVGTAVVLEINRDAEAGAWAMSFKLYDRYENSSYGSDIGDMTGAALGDSAGSQGSISAYDTTYDGYDLGAGATTGSAGGTMFEITIMPSAEGTLSIGNYESNYTVLIDHADLSIVPEPMTIALLGLGGLFLRRRK
jgi:hypothetical protein